MKKLLYYFVLFSFVSTATAMAGYRNIEKAERTEGHSIQSESTAKDQHGWEALLIREDGTRLPLKYLGDRFASVALKRGEVVQICVVVPGLKTGENVNLEAVHGGRIEGATRTRMASKTENELCFSFTMGTMGAHPVRIAAAGRVKSMVFLTEPVSRGPISTAEQQGGAINE